MDRINNIWENHANLEPSYDTWKRPKVLEVFKLLPRTNCKECGVPTCMAFADGLSKGNKRPEECSPLLEDDCSQALAGTPRNGPMTGMPSHYRKIEALATRAFLPFACVVVMILLVGCGNTVKPASFVIGSYFEREPEPYEEIGNGYKFLVVDIEVDNLSKKLLYTELGTTINQPGDEYVYFELHDSEGHVYPQCIMYGKGLELPESVDPEATIQGYITFAVPVDWSTLNLTAEISRSPQLRRAEHRLPTGNIEVRPVDAALAGIRRKECVIEREQESRARVPFTLRFNPGCRAVYLCPSGG